MSDEMEYLDDAPPPDADMTIMETFIAIITKPNKETFDRIAAQPGATMGKGFLWAFVGILLSSFLTSIAQMISFSTQADVLKDLLPPDLAPLLDAGAGASISFVTLLCTIPFAAAFGVFFFMIGVALVQWVAKLFGGTGTFEKLFYSFSVILVPVAVVSGGLALLSAIPFIGLCFGIISFGLVIYQIILQVLAVQAVNDLDTGKAVGAVILPGLLMFLFVCCCVILFGTLAASVMGDVFNEIGSGLY